MNKILSTAVLAIATLAGSAQAAGITGLVNTGLDAQGTQDTSYALFSVESGTVTDGYAYVSKDNVWPVGTWLANTDVSRWITPTADQAESLDPSADGKYTFRLSFDLTGYNASTAAFTGHFAADNSAEIYLNGTKLTGATGFTSWHDFSASSGFLAGPNTLDFVLTNDAQGSGNPAGLRVEFASSNVSAVPEPETYAMLMAGLGLVGFAARRRKAA
ncbi:MAG: FxDxF family PEP-CTERM protein [Sphingomonadaceae bacterium]